MALAETDCPAAKEMYQVNFFAPFELMRLFRKNVDSGVVVNLLDQRVALVDPDASVYNFSKKSLRDATEACALAWAPEIRVNGIAPGVVLPPAGGSMEKMRRILRRVPMGRRTTEEEIASAALWLAEGWMTGNILYLDGGLHLTAPAESALPSG
jgi:NAD(P)-dependent dehydrogenase (short-subunit alcohol dehydrogenase family)